MIPEGTTIELDHLGTEPVCYDGGSIYSAELSIEATHDGWKLKDDENSELDDTYLYTISIASLIDEINFALKQGVVEDLIIKTIAKAPSPLIPAD